MTDEQRKRLIAALMGNTQRDQTKPVYGTEWQPERIPEPLPPDRQIYRGPPRNRHERRAMKKQRAS